MIRNVTRRAFPLCRWLGLLALLGIGIHDSRADDPPVAQWIARGGGPLFDDAGAVAVDTAGNVYFAGTFQTNGTFGSTGLSAVDGTSLFLAKLNSSGVFQWARHIESGVIGITEPIRLQFDLAGKLLLMCTPAGDGGVNPPLNQLLIGKYEPATGNTIWTRKIQSTFFADTLGRGLAQDAAGNIYVAGSFSGTTSFGAGFSRTTSGGLDAFTLKLNPSGTTLNVSTFGQPGAVANPDDEMFGVTVDAAGNVWAVGAFFNTMQVGTTTLTSAGGSDMALVKYDSNLNIIWARRYGSTGADYGRGVARDSGGNVFVHASFETAYVFGPSFPAMGFLVAKLDASGNAVWATTAPTSYNTTDSYGFVLDSANNILLCGGSYLAKFNPQGTVLWQKATLSENLNDIAVLNNTNLYLATSASGVYTLDSVKVTNALSADALVIKMTVPPVVPPVITVQPTNQTVLLGGNAFFTVGATGSPPIAYQWRLYGTNLPGQTTASLNLFGVQSSQAGSYSVVVGNSAGAVTSQVAALTVTINPPTITAHPISLTRMSSSNANFSVGASGSPPLSYQWRLYGTNVPGAASQFYDIPSVTPAMAGPYTVVVSNPGGSVTSQVATLTITYIAPTNLRHPTNMTVLAGSNIVFYSGAYASPPITYQWQKNGTNFGSPGSATLQLNNVQPSDSGLYRLVISNPGGTNLTSNAVLTVQTILNQGPTFQWVRSGGGGFGDNGESVATDKAGNIYLSGTTAGTFNFAGFTSTNDAGPFIVKLDAAGNGLWWRRARNAPVNSANTVVATDGTNVFLAGAVAVNSTFYFGNVAIAGSASGVTFVVKYDANGNQLWVKRVGVAEAPRIAADGAGGVYLAGSFLGTLVLGNTTLTNQSTDVYLTRLDAAGNHLWARNGKSLQNASRPNSVKVDASGNVWLAGYFSTRLNLGTGTPLTNHHSTIYPQCFVARLEPTGNLLWQTSTTNQSSIYAAVLDISGGTNAVVAGTSQLGTTVWGTNTVSGGLWIGRINGAGQMLEAASGTNWATQPSLGVAVDGWGNAYLATLHGPNSVAAFGNGAVTPHQEISRALLARWNADGSWEWARTEGRGLNNSLSLARSVAVAHDGSPVFIGTWSGTNRIFGSTTVTNTGTGANAGNTEVWIGKIQSEAASFPVLSSAVLGNSLRLSWPAGAGNYVVETSPDLSVPFGPLVYTATTNAGTGQVEAILPVTQTNAFFILRRL